tara:strand:- start:1059 stop:1547 length:489 start_codon:yes stop_codon:yes gene_type:complete
VGEIEIPEHRQRRQALDAAQKDQQLRECPRGHHQLLAFDQLAINEQRIAGGSLFAFGFAALGIGRWSLRRLGLIALKGDASGSRFHRQLGKQGVELIGARHDLQQLALIGLSLLQPLARAAQTGAIGSQCFPLALQQLALLLKRAVALPSRQKPSQRQTCSE